ncbi:hypothetical protein [Asticcacaulis benevestitus]|uniref:Uncharacterized protein n=1 Tax=Asticcacaulis benevestitus DSM 16100 = ATCC BAA-896 TaxID=1121022 RepID=V4Q7Z6_9CAUL|nr:hypothetical protein [Asticcacaulis benevestitus]ESQ93970.1 hypothetical protein ABENE_04585 [Asticcacaulis benevestitus DSM 16100 = ATCC BAA-896]
MTNDALKSMLTNDAPAAPPARDIGFVVEVMKRVELRRLYEGLAWLTLIFTTVTALLFITMPVITPALTGLGQAMWPLVIAIGIAGFSLVGFEQTRRVFNQLGWRF